MKEILLPNGMITVVDDEDFEIASQYRWSASKTNRYYVTSHAKGRPIQLHRLVTNATCPAIDHFNGNPLDNRKCNLRPATKTQNGISKRIKFQTKLRGIREIKINGEIKFYGEMYSFDVAYKTPLFDTESEATRAYDALSINVRGDLVFDTFRTVTKASCQTI